MNDKHALFVEKYLACRNRTQAAIEAGYSPKTAYSIGARLLKSVEVSEAISQRLSESAMLADEVLGRLTEHARGSIGEFVKIENGAPVFDFDAASKANKLHLIKKLKTKTKTYASLTDEDTFVREVDVEFELYDAQAALVHLGKHHKLFTEKTEVDVTTGGEKLPSAVQIYLPDNGRGD